MTERHKPWWMCPLEWEMQHNPHWELVHDGKHNPSMNERFGLGPDEVRCFIRKYRCIGGLWGHFFKKVAFRYDLREGKADICTVEWQEDHKAAEAHEHVRKEAHQYG